MVAAAFTINQADGAGAGILSRSRVGLWRDQEVELVAETAGDYQWALLDKPGGSSATLSSNVGQTVTITPDVNGTYLVRLVVGRSTMTRLFRVSQDSSGTRDGVWPLPAFGEGPDTDNAGGNERGSTPLMEDTFADIYDTLQGLLTGSIGTGSPNHVIYWPGGTEVPGVYGTFADALAAAAALPGLIDLYISGDDDPPEITSGNHNLENRIRLRGYSALGTGSVPLTILAGGRFLNACLLENLSLEGELTAPLFYSNVGALQIRMESCQRIVSPDGDELFELGAGTNTLDLVDTILATDTAAAVTLTTGKTLNLSLRRSSLNSEAIYGTDGTLTLVQDGGSSIDLSNFSGTLDQYRDAVSSHAFYGVAGTQSSDPADGTGWATVGTVRIDPSILARHVFATRSWSLHADLEVVEASAGSVQVELRLLDASLTSLGSFSSTLSGASTFPEHKSTSLTAGASNGQIKSAATTYLVQIRRVGGSVGDVALVHNVYVEASWS